MLMNILSKTEIREFIKKEFKLLQTDMYTELNKMREIILKLEEDNRLIRKLLR